MSGDAREFRFLLRFGNLPVADVIVEAEKRLQEMIALEAAAERTDTEREALRKGIEELRQLVRRNVC